MLGWSQTALAEAAKVSRATVVDFERGLRVPHRNNLSAIREALENAGIHCGKRRWCWRSSGAPIRRGVAQGERISHPTHIWVEAGLLPDHTVRPVLERGPDLADWT